MSCQENYWNTQRRNKGVYFILVVEVRRRSPKSEGNDVHWHYNHHEKQAIDYDCLFQNQLAASIENCKIKISQEVNLNLELIEELDY